MGWQHLHMNDQSKLRPIEEAEDPIAEFDSVAENNGNVFNQKLPKVSSSRNKKRVTTSVVRGPIGTGLFYMAMGGLLWIANKATYCPEFTSSSTTKAMDTSKMIDDKNVSIMST